MAKFSNELNNYQSIPRELVFDTTLSDRARFVYCFMACKPDGWDFYLEPMAKEIGYSVDTLRKYINELVASGWIKKGEQEREKGIFGATQYTLKATNSSDTGKIRHGESMAQYNKDNIQKRDNIQEEIEDKSSTKKKKEYDEFVERMYALYPAKCPIRGASLGKSYKDKERIQKLLRQYTEDEIESVFKNEIAEKYGKHYMQNFSTFLNNFPDPNVLFAEYEEGQQMTTEDKLIVNGVIYR